MQSTRPPSRFPTAFPRCRSLVRVRETSNLYTRQSRASTSEVLRTTPRATRSGCGRPWCEVARCYAAPRDPSACTQLVGGSGRLSWLSLPLALRKGAAHHTSVQNTRRSLAAARDPSHTCARAHGRPCACTQWVGRRPTVRWLLPTVATEC